MQTAQRAPLQFALLILAASAVLGGCGRKQTEPLSEGSETASTSTRTNGSQAALDLQTEQKLDPLTRADVEIYLRVMRAAAERVKNPVPNDSATLDAAKGILERSKNGRVPSPDDVKSLERANLVAVAMDQIIANEMKLDGRAYRGIAEAVESVVPEAGAIAVRDSSAPAHGDTPLEMRLSEVDAANSKFLAPYREEITKLLAIVRNPARLPK